MNVATLTKTVPANGHLQLELPEFSNQQIEVAIHLTNHSKRQSESLITLQEKSGFVQTVLADKAEDVWNDL